MSTKKRGRAKENAQRFQKALERAKRPAEIYGYHATKFHEALDSGLSETKARGIASTETATKYKISRRQVENIVGEGKNSWAAKERKLMQTANNAVDLAAFDERAGVLQWLTPEELLEGGSVRPDDIRELGFEAAARAAKEKMRPLPELALLAIPRVNARVRELEIALGQAEEREKQIVGKLIACCRSLGATVRKLEANAKRLQTQLAAAEASNPFSAKRNTSR